MQLIDYTHPDKVPSMHLPHDRRSALYYLRLYELPKDHPYHYSDWCLFRHEEWLEAGACWVHAHHIAQDLEYYAQTHDLSGELRPVVGSGDHGYDEGLAQALKTFGLRPLVAELTVAPALLHADKPAKSY